MGNYKKILSSFKLQENLNPKIWYTPKDENSIERMIPKVRNKLLEIANEFANYLHEDLIVSDVVMTGSLANYNWSEFSDVDLHLLIDFEQFNEDQTDIFKEMFKLKKTLFNSRHNIKIYNFEVELYAQDEKEVHYSTGMYSVLFNEWIFYPKKDKVEIDKDTLLHKVNSWTDSIDSTIESAENKKDLEDSMKLIQKLKEKLKTYRAIGLEKKGEFSYENLVFKFLRRNGYIQKLFDFEDEVIDKSLSLSDYKNN